MQLRQEKEARKSILDPMLPGISPVAYRAGLAMIIA
jgi:hypothetical protein